MVAGGGSLDRQEAPKRRRLHSRADHGAPAGVLLPPKGLLRRVAETVRQDDILFIADEVITGFGRTGHGSRNRRHETEARYL